MINVVLIVIIERFHYIHCEIHTNNCFLAGYRLFKFVMFLGGFLLGFFISYMLCSAYLTDELSGDALKYKDQVGYRKS